MLAGDGEKGGEQLGAVPSGRRRILATSPAGPDMDELLQDLDRRRRLDGALRYRGDQFPTWAAQGMLGAHRIDEDRRVEDDHARRARRASSSSRSSKGSGTGMSGASSRRRPAARRRSPGSATPRSIASRATGATGAPRSRATEVMRA